MTQIESPCRLVCTLDLHTDWCLGCGRTRDEIARWVQMSADEREATLVRLPARLAELEKARE